MEGITIQRTTAIIIAGFIIALLFGAYTVFSAPGPGKGPASGVNISDQPAQAVQADQNIKTTQTAQDVYIRALSDGTYDKKELDVRKGGLVRLHFTADPSAGCGRQMVVYGLGVKAISQSGEEDIVEFTPQQEGTYEISCGMRMWGPAELVVSS